jgi:hypothetical protein
MEVIRIAMEGKETGETYKDSDYLAHKGVSIWSAIAWGEYMRTGQKGCVQVLLEDPNEPQPDYHLRYFPLPEIRENWAYAHKLIELVEMHDPHKGAIVIIQIGTEEEFYWVTPDITPSACYENFTKDSEGQIIIGPTPNQ